MLVYESLVPISYRKPFIEKVRDISAKLNINPNWLMAVMALETAKTFSPSITNSLGYTGLIQFGKAAAQDLGTTTDALRKMSAVEQLDYVYKYLSKYKSKFNSLTDVYLSVLFPYAVGKGDDFLIESPGISASKFRNANPGFDKNKDGKVYVWEVRKKILEYLPSEWLNEGSATLALKAYKLPISITIGSIIIALMSYKFYGNYIKQ